MASFFPPETLDSKGFTSRRASAPDPLVMRWLADGRFPSSVKEDLSDLQAAILEYVKGSEKPDDNSFIKQERSPDDADFLALAFRSTLQAVLQEAHDDMKYEQVMEYHLQEQQTSTPAVVRLLEAAAALGRRNSNKSLQALLFQMVEDIIAVCDMVDVRECFAHMRRLLGLAARSVQATLQVQRATKQLLTRFSGTSDPGIRGEVLLLAAEALHLNHRSGVNSTGDFSKVEYVLDTEMQPSVDGSSPVAADVYQDLWNLQSILQNPWGCMVTNDSYKGATDLIEEGLRVMAATPIKVVSRSTAVPPKGGIGDLHLKYLTSSKLTKLQLADSAFQRTVLTQCLIFLDACLHRPFPADEQNPPGLKEAQVDKTLNLMKAAFTRLSSIQDDGPQYVAALKAHFREEHHWMRWKCKPKLSSPANTITADFVKQPCEALSEDVEQIAYRPRKLDRPATRPPPKEAGEPEGQVLPLESALAPVGQEMDPEEDVDEQYKKKNDLLYKTALRRKARRLAVKFWMLTWQQKETEGNLECLYAALFRDSVSEAVKARLPEGPVRKMLAPPLQASGRSSLTSPSAAKQGAADEISLEVEGLDGATDLASEAQSPVRGTPEVAAAAAAADAPAPMDVEGVDQSAAGPGEAPAAAAAAGLGHDGAAEAGAPDADAAVAEAGKGGSGSASRKRKAAGAADGVSVEAAAEVGTGSVAGSQAASAEAAAVTQEEGLLLEQQPRAEAAPGRKRKAESPADTAQAPPDRRRRGRASASPAAAAAEGGRDRGTVSPSEGRGRRGTAAGAEAAKPEASSGPATRTRRTRH